MPVPDASRQEMVEQSLGIMRRVVSRSFSRRARLRSASAIDPGHHLILHFLQHHPGATQKDVASFLGFTPGHVSHLVESMEDAGLLRRRRGEEDRRTLRLHQTLRARHLHYHLHRDGRGLRPDSGFDQLTDDEVRALRDVLQRLDDPGSTTGAAPR